MCYPGVLVAALKYMHRVNKEKELETLSEYYQECKEKTELYEKNYRNVYPSYTLYVYGYLEPWFRELREAGKLTQGKATLLTDLSFCLRRETNGT